MIRHPVHVVLRDGSGVLVRPVRSTDALLLADGFARLSERSRRFTGVVSFDNVPMGMLLRNVGAVETHRSLGTVEYDIALERTGEYGLDWWFRCVDDGSVFTWG